MRKSVKEFIRICTETLPNPEPIYEFGALQVPGQEGFADLRPFFPAKEYVGTDMRWGPGVDKILDLHDIELAPLTVGTALCLDTLEHVEYPRKAMTELQRVLKQGGIVVISSHLRAKIHCFPNDYWRFTPECFESLLKHFPSSFVSYAGRELFPHMVVGIGFNGPAPPLQELEQKVQAWQLRWSSEKGSRPKESWFEKQRRKFAKSLKKRWNRILCKR